MSAESSEVQRRITAFWSLTAPYYDEHPGNVVPVGSGAYEGWVAFMRELLPTTPADVLDVGAGTGFVSLIAALLGHRVTGIDLSAEMLTVAREAAERRGLEVRWVLGDAVAPEFPEASFDVITNRNLIWTLREPQRAFANWRRLLRAGGVAISIGGYWSADDPSAESEPDEEPAAEDVFGRYYTRETRAALPGMRIGEAGELASMFMRAGFADAAVRELPVGLDPEARARRPYLVIARR